MARTDPRDLVSAFRQAKQQRSTHDQQFRLNAAYCLPREYGLWQSDGPPILDNSGVQAQVRRFVYDNTGVRSVPKFVAVLNRMMTPDSQRYHALATDNADLMKVRAVRIFFQDLTDMLFRLRYAPKAMFTQAQGESYASIGVYGTSCKVLLWEKANTFRRQAGFVYKQWPLRFVYLLVDDLGRVTHIFREFWLNYRQFKIKWPEAQPPQRLANEASLAVPSEVNKAQFVHCVYQRNDYDAGAYDVRRLPWSANYICVDDAVYIGEEEGFLSDPYIIARTFTAGGDPYGYSPAEQAFAALGSVSAIKKSAIKAGQKNIDPPLLANDDGALSGRLDMRPGAVNYGGIDKEGRELVKPLVSTASFSVAENMIADERNDIQDTFLASLFQLLEKNERMTTAEVYERLTLNASLVAPTMGRLQSEDQGPQIEREIALLVENGVLPEMPPELVEAKGEYSIRYTSPLARAMYAEDISGFVRWTELATNVAAQTGDPTPLFYPNWDDAMPEVGRYMNVRERWINPPDKVEQLRQQHAQQQQAQLLAKAAPAIASVATSPNVQGPVIGGGGGG